ncbi:TPA: MbeB family mobilization protein [Escherichia coli]|nr:mobilization protein [Escherichia coli]HAW3225125.1 mobilization protein [Escherichia coli]
MSSLLKMGTDLEQQLNEQANATVKMLNDEFSRLEKSVDAVLKSNEQKIKDAIQVHADSVTASLEKHRKGVKDAMMSQRESVLKLAMRTWLIMLSVIFLTFAVSGGALWYTGNLIAGNLEKIRQQNDTLKQLDAKTWGVRFHQEPGGKYLVLPEGMKADTGWKVEKRNAVKLEKE